MGLNIENGSTKFVKVFYYYPNLKFATTDLRGMSLVSFQSNSSSKVNLSLMASTPHHSSEGLLPLPAAIPTCDHYGELGHVIPHYIKLTSHLI